MWWARRRHIRTSARSIGGSCRASTHLNHGRRSFVAPVDPARSHSTSQQRAGTASDWHRGASPPGDFQMRFLSIYKSRETGAPPSPEHIETMTKLIEEGMKSGWLVATEGCLPSALGARVRQADGKTTVTDGPVSESKEGIGGFAVLDAACAQGGVHS